jgi:predicted transcriptional regulator of viral defense system
MRTLRPDTYRGAKANPLAQFGIIPIGFGALADVFRSYKAPQNKIASLEKEGALIRLKKGAYLVSGKIHEKILSRELVANHLYGPSYVSLESALARHGLIPERVHVVRSMTTRRGRKFSTPIGVFDYVSAPAGYHAIGIRQHIVENQYACLIASPEKAVCDMIVATRGLRLQSPKAVRAWLVEDLRADFDALRAFDAGIIRQCAAMRGKKNAGLRHLHNLLNQLKK